MPPATAAAGAASKAPARRPTYAEKAHAEQFGGGPLSPADRRSLGYTKKGGAQRVAGERDAYEAGVEEGRKSEKSGGDTSRPAGGRKQQPSRGSPRRVQPANVLRGRPVVSGGSPVQEGAGLVLGLVVYAVVFAYLQYGVDGVRGWFAAKFLNKPYAPAVAAAPKSPIAPSAAQPSSSSSTVYPPRNVLL